MIKCQCQTVQWAMVSRVSKVSSVQSDPHSCYNVTLQKRQGKVKVKTTNLMHNFIIPANCWNHDWRSKSNGSMGYRVHKVTPVHGTMCKNSKFSWPGNKVKKRSKAKQQLLCATSSSKLTVETMIEGKRQTVRWAMGSTKSFGRTHRRTVGITRSYRLRRGQ